MPRQGIYAIGVQHQGKFRVQQAAGQCVRLPAPAQAAADEGGVALCQAAANLSLGGQGKFAVRGGQREGHGLVGLHRRHGPDRLRDAQKHQARPGAHGGTGGENRGAGIAHAAAQAQHLAEIALVALRIAAGQMLRHIGRRQLRHGAPLPSFCRVHHYFIV